MTITSLPFNLANILAEISSPPELFESNITEVENVIEENTDKVNNNNEERRLENNRERSNILNPTNWRALIRIAGALLVMGAAS